MFSPNNNNNSSKSNRNIQKRNVDKFYKNKRSSHSFPFLAPCVSFRSMPKDEDADEVDCVNGVSASPQQKPRRRHLPLPTGPHTVGCVDLMCDVADHGTFFRLYYPTKSTDIEKSYKQWPLWLPRKQYAHGYIYFLKKNKIFGKLANLIGGEVYVPVLWQAPLLKSEEKFPIVIVSHGIGGNRTTMSTYCYELASHGFVVAAVEHRDGTASMTLCLKDQLNTTIRDVDDHLPHSKSENDISVSDEDSFDDDSIRQRGQFYLEREKPDQENEVASPTRARPRRQSSRRSMFFNTAFTEEWRRFQHVEIWNDFKYRNGQMYRRAQEIQEILDDLEGMNKGDPNNNLLNLAFKTTQFKDRLDTTRVAVIGHSFGGATVLATLATDERFKVGISLDGWFHPVDDKIDQTAKQPCLLFNMEEFQWEKNVKRMFQFQQAYPSADRPMLTLRGGCHQSMTDFQFIVPQLIGRMMDVCHTLEPDLCISTCVNTSLAFLYKHLDLPLEQMHQDLLEANSPYLMKGTNVDMSIPDEGPTPP